MKVLFTARIRSDTGYWFVRELVAADHPGGSFVRALARSQRKKERSFR
jgi:hypothetical protein